MLADDQEDHEQELISAAVIGLQQFDAARGSREALVTTIIDNRANTILESRKAARRDYRRFGGSLQDAIHGGPDGEPTERGAAFDLSEYLRLTRGEPDPEYLADLRIDLNRTIQSLPSDLQLICALLSQNMTKTEIADQLSISRATLHDRLKQLEKRLARTGISIYLNYPPTLRDRLR